MNILNLTRLLILASFLFQSFYVFAQNQTSKLEIEAHQYLIDHYQKNTPQLRTEIKINPISQQLRLKTCKAPIIFNEPRGTGNRITFRAKCPTPAWQIFITAKLNQYKNVVVARQSIAKNIQLSLSHLMVKEVDVTTLRSAYFQKESDIIGWWTKRSIAGGSTISANQLKPPYAIKKGYAILIEARRNGVTIRASGTALEDGLIGEQIDVQNDRSGNVVKGIVIEQGLVRVP